MLSISCRNVHGIFISTVSQEHLTNLKGIINTTDRRGWKEKEDESEWWLRGYVTYQYHHKIKHCGE